MKSPKKLALLVIFALSLAFNKGWAQVNKVPFHPLLNHIFDADSLSGFDEQSAKINALSEGFLGDEFKVYMFRQKRLYINAKFNIHPSSTHNFGHTQRVTNVAPACTNEDFEGSNPGLITAPNQINGWTVTGGSNNPFNTPGANSCNLNGCCPNNPSESALVQCPVGTGTIDPIIGGCYPIYSVFGTTSNNGNSVNPNLPPMGGDKVIRINNNVNDYSIEKLSKTFAVTANNALFQFAFISVFYPGHTCCDAGAFQIKLTNASANTVIACPSFSISAPSSQCAASNTAVTFYIGGGACPVNTSSNFSPIFNKWNFNSLDLSSYIGNNITIDIIATDCTAGGHYGYVYFDAQCSPMTIIGNGTGFPAGTPQITLPTCGASGATITAPTGLGPYSWNSSQISIPAGLTVPSNTNQTLVTNQSGTVQLTMNPPGSCQPINKIITVTITPAPIVVASATQANCSNTLSAASLTTAGSASVNPTIIWSPPPASLGSGSMSATGLAVGITTITVTDNTGCKTTATVNITATPPPVTFSVNNLTGSYSITCINPTINLSTSTSYTYGSINYNWSSTSFTATGNNVGITQTGTYNVCGIDPVTTCSMCQSFTINQNTTIPSNTVNPTTQVITCGVASAATFSSTAITPTNNIVHNWYSPATPYPSGPPSSSCGGTLCPYTALSPGTYTIEFCNLVNGCCNTKTVSVTSISGFPTFQTSSTTNYSVGCVPLNQTTLCIVNAQSTNSAAVQFAFLPPSSTATIPLSSSAFGASSCTITAIPGTWTVVVNDPSNSCQTAVLLQIIQNTVAPNVLASMNPVTQTLTCFNPTILATGSSTTPNTFITWQEPVGPPTVSTNTIILGPGTGPPTSTTNLVYVNYTVVATNTVNACKTLSTVVVSQNFRAPRPLISVGNPSVINCNGAPAILSFTNTAVTSSVNGAFAQVMEWQGPPPQATLATVAQYSAYVPGTYTLTVRDSYNGCYGSTTTVVPDLTQPPVLATPIATAPSGCGDYAPLTVNLSVPLTAWSLYFNEYPAAAAFTPSTAIQPANSPTYTGASATVTVDLIGVYDYILTNIQTGCKTTGTFVVGGGNLNAGFSTDPISGYAPLTVGFNNTSSTSTGATSSITSVWAFGNGTSSITANPNPSTTYTSPGTYTVSMISTRGGCSDTAYQVIKVEIPSKMDIPNVFTPNGDGSNDMFFLKTQNLTEITASIFDRWGNKVYEVTSNTGNIGWDGKSLDGKECPSGTYFYIIKATGKDSKAYDQKGNVSLYR